MSQGIKLPAPRAPHAERGIAARCTVRALGCVFSEGAPQGEGAGMDRGEGTKNPSDPTKGGLLAAHWPPSLKIGLVEKEFGQTNGGAEWGVSPKSATRNGYASRKMK